MKGEVKTTNRIQELVEGINRQEGNKHELYKELIKIASAEELGSQYTKGDFNLYFYGDSLTVDDKVQIINKGYYKEFSNLVGFSSLPFNEEVDTDQLHKGIELFIDRKLIPWVELSDYHQEVEFISFYEALLREFIQLNKKYLGNDRQLEDLLKRTGVLISGLRR